MAAGLTDRAWTIDDLVKLLDEAERAVPQKRGPYKKRAPKSTAGTDSK